MKITKRQLKRIIQEEKAKVLAEQKVRRIVREQVRAESVVFDEDRFGYTIDGQRVPDEAMGGYTKAAEDGDVQTMADHLIQMGVTHVAGDIDTLDALGLGPDDIIPVDEWRNTRI